MKSKLWIVIIALLAAGPMINAQSPEEMQKMMDSLMGDIPEDQKQFIQQMMKKGQEADAQRKSKKEQAKNQQLVKSKAAQKRNEDEFYWRNTMATDTQGKFENWSYGNAVIRTKLFNRDTKEFMDLELGTVSSSGQVNIQLPNLDFRKWPRIPITKPSSEGDHMLFDTEHLVFSNKNVTYFSTRFDLSIYQGTKNLGYLKMGNNIKPVVNLNAPCCFDKAGDGYTTHWVFMSQANTITGKKGYVSHDLKFQKGWNLIVVKVEGAKEKPSSGIPGPKFWKNQYYTAVSSLPSDAKYYFTKNQ